MVDNPIYTNRDMLGWVSLLWHWDKSLTFLGWFRAAPSLYSSGSPASPAHHPPCASVLPVPQSTCCTLCKEPLWFDLYPSVLSPCPPCVPWFCEFQFSLKHDCSLFCCQDWCGCCCCSSLVVLCPRETLPGHHSCCFSSCQPFATHHFFLKPILTPQLCWGTRHLTPEWTMGLKESSRQLRATNTLNRILLNRLSGSWNLRVMWNLICANSCVFSERQPLEWF